jgi:curved DNA-binding protein CbpA
MKRSFYQLLDIPRDAAQVEIDTAFKAALAKLNIVTRRGVAETLAEEQLLRDGYTLLSNPEKRALYDAKLRAEENGDGPISSTLNSARRVSDARESKGTVLTAVLAGGAVAIAAVIGISVYRSMAVKMDAVNVEHLQSVARQKDEPAKIIVIEMPQPKPSIASSPDDGRKR